MIEIIEKSNVGRPFKNFDYMTQIFVIRVIENILAVVHILIVHLE